MDNEEKKYFRDIKTALRKLSEIGVPVTPIIKAVMNAESELRESEDERIRKFLIEKFSKLGEIWPEYSTKTILAWLEKQKIPEGSPTPDLTTMLVPNRYNEQKPAERSEEDEYYRNQLIVFCENCMQQDSEAIRCADWLKSLHTRPISSDTWKPSEEQMAALAAAKMGVDTDYELLESLYEQLKAL